MEIFKLSWFHQKDLVEIYRNIPVFQFKKKCIYKNQFLGEIICSACSLQQRVVSFHAESKSIFGKNFRTIIEDLFTNKVNCVQQNKTKKQ